MHSRRIRRCSSPFALKQSPNDCISDFDCLVAIKKSSFLLIEYVAIELKCASVCESVPENCLPELVPDDFTIEHSDRKLSHSSCFWPFSASSCVVLG